MSPQEEFRRWRMLAAEGFVTQVLKKMPVFKYAHSMGIKDYYKGFQTETGIDLGILHVYWENGLWHIRWYASGTPESEFKNYTQDIRSPEGMEKIKAEIAKRVNKDRLRPVEEDQEKEEIPPWLLN